MTKLSPAALAVMDAVVKVYPAFPDEVAAATLRAAANEAQKLIFMTTPSTDWGKGWKEGVRDVANGLLSIAAELEGAQ